MQRRDKNKLTRARRRSFIVLVVLQHHFPSFRPWAPALRRWRPCICTQSPPQQQQQKKSTRKITERWRIARGHEPSRSAAVSGLRFGVAAANMYQRFAFCVMSECVARAYLTAV